MKKKWYLVLAIVVVILSLVTVGCQGDQGLRGEKGEQGIQGIQGIQGEKGEKGEQGIQGLRGLTGVTGDKGDTGEKGEKGDTGDTGDTGASGGSGGQGAQGIQGIQGVQGLKGDKGDTGDVGAVGPISPFSSKLSVRQWEENVDPETNASIEFFNEEWVIRVTTSGDEGSGNTATLDIIPVKPMALGQLLSLSWLEYLLGGYPPHLDILIDTDGDGIRDDALVAEYAYNSMSHYAVGQPTYGALTGAWYAVFSDDGEGTSVVNDGTFVWLSSQAPGPWGEGYVFGDNNFWGATLGDWKAGLEANGISVNQNTLVTGLRIEVDNWIVNTDAYLKGVVVNGLAVAP